LRIEGTKDKTQVIPAFNELVDDPIKQWERVALGE
jgi:hypothetical protein